ncbi:hypothetical protein DFR71_5042 [Nocardia alba]|uniref:Uncharacterized protein n=1 Tax=Nocardia alba TaxID=225051 RepID=A0A4R1FJ63_9NOCA|nr:hypothetical protein DFR71_5042 [Nocardia alba]
MNDPTPLAHLLTHRRPTVSGLPLGRLLLANYPRPPRPPLTEQKQPDPEQGSAT